MYKEVGCQERPDLETMQKVVDHQSEWFLVRGLDGTLHRLGRIITDYSRYAFIVDVTVTEQEFSGETSFKVDGVKYINSTVIHSKAIFSACIE